MDKEQIIKIKGKEDEWYQEAIFIIKKDIINVCGYKDLREKADTIIGNYAKQNGLGPQIKPKPVDWALNLILGSSIVILIICLYLL